MAASLQLLCNLRKSHVLFKGLQTGATCVPLHALNSTTLEDRCGCDAGQGGGEETLQCVNWAKMNKEEGGKWEDFLKKSSLVIALVHVYIIVFICHLHKITRNSTVYFQQSWPQKAQLKASSLGPTVMHPTYRVSPQNYLGFSHSIAGFMVQYWKKREVVGTRSSIIEDTDQKFCKA